MPPAPKWSEIKGNAQRLAERGRGGLIRASDRFRRFTEHPSDRPAWRASDPGPSTVLEPHEHHRRLTYVGGAFLLLAAIVVLIITIWDWNWFRGPLAGYASIQTQRQVRIDGDLKVKLLTLTPVISVNGLKIGDPSWAGKGDTAQIETLKVKVKALPLVFGRVEVPSIELQKPKFHLVRDETGRANWRFGRDQGDHPTRLPPIQQLTIRDGQVDFADAGRRLRLLATIQSSEELTPAGKGVFRLTGNGSLNSRPLTLSVTGGPLIQVRRNRPYGFVADVRMAGTHVKANGAILKPFDFGAYDAKLNLSGPDLADLYYLTGMSFPNTRAYDTSGAFSRRGSVYKYEGFTGHIGNSDISGNLKVSKPKARPLLEADLRSRSLDFGDLTTIVGGGEKVSMSSGASMPDAKLDTHRWRAIDAHVTYRAASVKANALRLTAVKLGLRLDDGLMVVDPVAFGFARGQLTGKIRVDGRKAVPLTNIDLKLTGYRLENLIPARFGGALTGPLAGRFTLQGSGASLRQTAASASGSIRLESDGGGEVRQAFAELLGINVGKGLSLLLNKDPKRTPLRCAVADVDVHGGVGRVRRMVIDTGVVTSRGEGSLNLVNQTIDLRLKGDSKEPRLLRLWAPITLHGPLGKPKVGVEAGGVAAQAGLGAALGALVSPLAAVIPFVDPGGKDVNCQALLAAH